MWTELRGLRQRCSRTYQDTINASKRRCCATLAALHYESEIDSGQHDIAVDCTPVRVQVAALDGWRVNVNSWHYALGHPQGKQDGWVGFGGRQGAHWFQFRLLRAGYLHWPTRAWDDIGGAPDYNRANLSQQTRICTLGPNNDEIPVESLATWSSLWTTPGGGTLDVSWKIRGDALKEEISINQAAREWIAANRPPSTPLSETWFGFVFQVDWSDIPKIVRAGILQDPEGDFGDDDENIELRDALDRLLALMPLDSCTASTPSLAERITADHAPLRKRFWKDGDNYYLLVGLRCNTLNAMKSGPLVFDPTIQVDISETAHDGFSEDTNDEMIDPATSAYDVFYLGFDFAPVDGAWIWTTTIADGATIDAATVTLQLNGPNYAGTVNGDWYGFDVDAPDNFDAAHVHRISDHHTRTSATVADDFEAPNGPHTSPELKTILQEIVDRAGVGANPEIGLTYRSTEDNVNEYYAWMDYSDDSAKTAQLDVEYTGEAAIFPPVPGRAHRQRRLPLVRM